MAGNEIILVRILFVGLVISLITMLIGYRKDESLIYHIGFYAVKIFTVVGLFYIINVKF